MLLSPTSAVKAAQKVPPSFAPDSWDCKSSRSDCGSEFRFDAGTGAPPSVELDGFLSSHLLNDDVVQNLTGFV